MAIVTNVGAGCGGRGSVGRAMCSQGELNLMSGHAAPDERRLNALAGNFGRQHMSPVGAPREGSCGRQNRVVLAPVAGVKLMEIVGPDRASIDRQSVSDGGKTNSSPGRARHKPLKPLRREGRVFRRTCGPSCAFLRMTAGAEGTRLSCALHSLRANDPQASGAWRREIVDACRLGCRAGMIDRKEK